MEDEKKPLTISTSFTNDKKSRIPVIKKEVFKKTELPFQDSKTESRKQSDSSDTRRKKPTKSRSSGRNKSVHFSTVSTSTTTTVCQANKIKKIPENNKSIHKTDNVNVKKVETIGSLSTTITPTPRHKKLEKTKKSWTDVVSGVPHLQQMVYDTSLEFQSKLEDTLQDTQHIIKKIFSNDVDDVIQQSAKAIVHQEPEPEIVFEKCRRTGTIPKIKILNKSSRANMFTNENICSIERILAGIAFKKLEPFNIVIPKKMRKQLDSSLNTNLDLGFCSSAPNSTNQLARSDLHTQSMTDNILSMYPNLPGCPPDYAPTNTSECKPYDPYYLLHNSLELPEDNFLSKNIRLYNINLTNTGTQSKFSCFDKNETKPNHCAVWGIERIEATLEMILSSGFKFNDYSPQLVPIPVMKAMSDVKTFLEPIKAHLVATAPSVYYKPFIDTIINSLSPIYHHLNDKRIAQEGPLRNKHITIDKDDIRYSTSDQQTSEQEDFSEIDNFDKSISLNNCASNFDLSHDMAYIPITKYSHVRVIPNGLMEFKFLHDFQVVLTIDFAIIVLNKVNKVMAAISPDGQMAGFKFAYGECCLLDNTIDMTVMNTLYAVDKRAKITDKGIYFKGENSVIGYLVSEAGICSNTKAPFTEFTNFFMSNVFYGRSTYGPEYVEECTELIHNAKNNCYGDGTIVWFIKNIKLMQSRDGRIILHRDNAKYTIIMAPEEKVTNKPDGSMLVYTAKLITPKIHVTASVTAQEKGSKFHMLVRQGTKKIYSNNSKFSVQNGSQAASLNADNKICVEK